VRQRPYAVAVMRSGIFASIFVGVTILAESALVSNSSTTTSNRIAKWSKDVANERVNRWNEGHLNASR